MKDTDPSYETVARAVRGRWRRRLLAMAHVFAFLVTYFTILAHSTWYAGSWNTFWVIVLGFHLMWAVIAELRDRSIRREIERERKWRLLERLEAVDVYEPYARERLMRMSDAPDGELIDFDAEAWADDVKRKRG
ncbi:MAG: hypothetical protein IT320_23915 [Anaerolineae bacterium]|nr:hypothetical protein [Anaerolineae bacterium]